MARVLLVTYEFPPRGGPGVQRPLKTARYLAQAGWDVTVLTVEDPPTSIVDEELLAELPDNVSVERAWSLEPTRVVQWLRRVRGPRIATGDASGDAPAGARGYSGMPRWAIKLVQSLTLPDEKIGWSPYAVRRARALHAAAPFDVILASGPPFTSLHIAGQLSRRLNIPWVADLRDPVYGGYFFKPATRLHAQWMHRFEARVVHTASRTIVVTAGMRDEIVRRHPDTADRVSVVTNGFDREDFQSGEPATHEGFVIAYVGTFQGTITPDAFLQGLEIALDERPELRDDVQVVFAGPEDDDTAQAIARTHVSDHVRRVGFVSHKQATVLMRSSDVLLLVLGPEPESSAILTGKLPEYLGAGRPVLALVPAGDAAGVVRQAGGIVVHPGDVPAIAQGILALYDMWRTGSLPVPPATLVERFDRRTLVGRVGAILEAAIHDKTDVMPR